MNEMLSQKLIGYRVKALREKRDWVQSALSEKLGFNDRQTLSDIENGKRSLKPEELVALCSLLDTTMDYFLDVFSVSGEAKFSWRAEDAVTQTALDEFETRASKWVGLLRWLRTTQKGKSSPLKQSLRLTSQSSYEEAIDHAEQLVEMLQLGNIPAKRLASAIDSQLDIPVLFVDAIDSPSGSVSGAACHLHDLGIILVSRQESEARRFFTLAHELFHALTWDTMAPEHRESNSIEARSKGKAKRIETLANSFAAALLMPTSALNFLIHKDRLADVNHLVEAANELRTSPKALAWRLFNMKWITEGVCHELVAHGALPEISERPKRFSEEFVQMLHQAIFHGRLSARKAAKALEFTLPGLAGLFDEYALDVPFDM